MAIQPYGKSVLQRGWGLVMIAGILWMSGCSTAPAPTTEIIPTPETATVVEPRPGGTLVYATTSGLPRHFNHALVSGAATIVPGTQIFASPLRYDENWNPQPYLAKIWDISDDGLTVTLDLVEGATFHDGHPITSKDVAFSIMLVKEYHPFKTMFAPVDSVDTPDDQTVVIHLSQPHPAMLLAMSPPLLPILPQHIYGDGQDILTHPANLAPVGSGPFKFVQYVDGEYLELARYDDFFIPDRPYLDRIILLMKDDAVAVATGLEHGDIHMTGFLANLTLVNRLRESDHLVDTSAGYEAIGPLSWLAINLLHEPLDNILVRQAIAYTIDTDFITQTMQTSLGVAATGPIAPESPFYEPDVSRYEIDLEKAAQLLDEAGYPPGEDGIRFSLTLDYIPIIAEHQEQVAVYIARQLSKIGVAVVLRDSENFPAWAERIGNWDFDMTMDIVYNWGDPVIGVHRTYMSDNIHQGAVWTNTQNYRNDRVDELLEQAAVEMDFQKRKQLYSEFQKIITQELPIVYTTVITMHTIYDQGLSGPPLSIWGTASPFDDIFWQDPPANANIERMTEAPVAEGSPLPVIGQAAIDLLERANFFDALRIFKDPTQGYLDLQGTGLHLIAFTSDGTILMDTAGRIPTGTDISALLDMKGNPVFPRLLAAAEESGVVKMEDAFVHPGTQEIDTVSVWCTAFAEGDVLCGLVWE